MRRLPLINANPYGNGTSSSPAPAPPPQVPPRGGGGARWGSTCPSRCRCRSSPSPAGAALLRGSARLRQAGGAFYTETKTVDGTLVDEDIPSGPNMTIQLR